MKACWAASWSPAAPPNVAVNAPIAILVETRRSRPPRSRPLRSRPPLKPPHRRPPPRRHPRQTPQFPPRRQAPPTAPSTTLHRPRPRPPNTASSPPPWPAASRATPGIDLATIKGTGPQGRIVRADIERAPATPVAAVATPAAIPHTAPAPAAPAITAPHRLVPLSSMRRIIARRLTESKQTVPHFYLTADLRLDALLKLRADLNARSPKEGPAAFKLSVNDLLIKAAAVALREVPDCNASYNTDAGIAFYDDIDIAIAVATPGGLITPIIRQADRKGIVAVSLEMKDLAARAKANRLKPEEFQGGGFSISNLGMYGVTSFSAIINPPQGAILAIGAGEQRPVVTDGALAIATMMSCTLSGRSSRDRRRARRPVAAILPRRRRSPPRHPPLAWTPNST